jgi:hypothetical protein
MFLLDSGLHVAEDTSSATVTSDTADRAERPPDCSTPARSQTSRLLQGKHRHDRVVVDDAVIPHEPACAALVGTARLGRVRAFGCRLAHRGEELAEAR